MISSQELVISCYLCHGISGSNKHQSGCHGVVAMAPRRPGKVRVRGLRVDKHPAGAQDDGDHRHQHSQTQSIEGQSL